MEAREHNTRGRGEKLDILLVVRGAGRRKYIVKGFSLVLVLDESNRKNSLEFLINN